MAKKVVGLLSGRKKHKITGEFVSLDNTEPYLGAPDSNNSIIISHTDGSRNFYKLDSSSLTLDNINNRLSVNFPGSLDSAEAIALIDSAHVQLRQTPQDFAYASLTGVPTNVSQFANDAGYLTDADTLDSAEVIGLVDSAYVQQRQTPQDFAYSSLTGAPTTVSTFTNDANYISTGDSAVLHHIDVTSNVVIGGNLQVQGTTFTANTASFSVDENIFYLNDLESAGSPTQYIDVGFSGNVNDKGSFTHAGFFRDATDATWKVFETYNPLPDTAEINTGHASFSLGAFEANTLTGQYLGFDSDFTAKSTTDLSEGSNLYYTTSRADSDFDIRLATKSTTNLVEGTNLYYTKSRVDSDIAFAFNDSNNTVNVTINNYIEDKVDSAYVLARVAAAPFLDSADAIGLIDSAYVQARQDYAYSSLTGVPTNVSTFANDAGYLTDADTLDSAEVIGLVDSAYVQLRQTPQDFAYASLTGAPTNVSAFANDAGYLTDATTLDSAEAIALIDSAHVQARQDYAYSSLTGAPTNVSDFTNDAGYLTSATAGVLDSANVSAIITNDVDAAFINALTIDADTLDGQSGSFYLDYNNFINTPNVLDSADIQAFTLDSAEVINLIDSAYVQARQSGGEITIQEEGTPLSTAATTLNFVGSAVTASGSGTTKTITISQAEGGTDSATVVTIIGETVDSAYVQARQDYAYASLTGTPTNVSDFTNDAGYLTDATTLDSAEVLSLIDSAYISNRFPTGGSSEVITPVAFAFVNTTANGSGTGISWSNWNAGTATLDFTFSTAQPDTNYAIITDCDVFDDYNVSISSKTTSGFSASFYDDTGGNRTPSSSAPFTFLIYGSNPKKRIAGLVGDYLDSAAAIALIDSAHIELRRPAETIFTVVNNGSSAYTFTGDGFSSGRDNPTLYLTRGKTYKFGMGAAGHPFQIRVSDGGSAYNTGVTNNGAQTGNIFFTPDMNAPTSLVYQCTVHSGMVGDIVILDNTDIFRDSAFVTGIIDSAYVQLRQTAAAGGTDSATVISLITSTVDSAYVALREADAGGGGGTDSATVSTIIINDVDSAYVQARQLNETAAELTQVNTVFTATAGQTSFTGLDIDSDKFQTYLNGLLLPRADFTHNSTQVDLLVAADSNDILEVIKFTGNDTGAQVFQQRHYIYTATSGQTVFTGSDDNSATLSYTQGRINVYLNGLLLLDSADYTQSVDGDTVTFTAGVTAGHVVDIQTLSGNTGAFAPLEQKLYEFIADSAQTLFTGSDDNGATLAYSANKVTVYINGILQTTADYTATNGTSITLNSAANLSDVITIANIEGNNIGLDSGQVNALISGSASVLDSAAVTTLINDYIVDTDVALTTVATDQIVDTFSASTYRTAKYIIQMSHSSGYHSNEILLVHDGSSVYMTTYAEVITASSLGTIDADINSGNVRLLFTPTNTNTDINITRINVDV